jgi:hypothetical protein
MVRNDNLRGLLLLVEVEVGAKADGTEEERNDIFCFAGLLSISNILILIAHKRYLLN